MPEHQQIQQSKKTNTIFQKQATPVVQTPVSNPYSIIQRAKINPRSLTRADIMQLQRTIGNQAVGRLLSSIGNTSTAQQATVQRQEIPEEEEEPLQGKMIGTIQRQEIPEEEEPLQGKMAKTIQRQETPEEEEPLQGKMAETIQRQEIPEEEEPLQGKFEIIQRQEIPEEEEPLQGKMIGTVQRQEIPEKEETLQGMFKNKHEKATCPSCSKVPIQLEEGNHTGMSDNLKSGVEQLSGMDLSDVRVHYNSNKPMTVGALAYAQGNDIYLGPGQNTSLPHELWHVVQQAQGRVRPTLQLSDLMVNDDVAFESEADVMGEKAAHTQGNINELSNHKVEVGNSKVVQCDWRKKLLSALSWSPVITSLTGVGLGGAFGAAIGLPIAGSFLGGAIASGLNVSLAKLQAKANKPYDEENPRPPMMPGGMGGMMPPGGMGGMMPPGGMGGMMPPEGMGGMMPPAEAMMSLIEEQPEGSLH